jgi:hypothetical protein
MLTIFSAERGPVLPVVDEQPSRLVCVSLVSFGALHVDLACGAWDACGGTSRDRMSRHGPRLGTVRVTIVRYRYGSDPYRYP